MKRTLIVLLLVNLMLSACAPVSVPTPIPAPSATPLPTATATPTSTPTATPTATPTPIPTIQVGDLSVPDPRVTNPELFDLRKPDAPIPQFVNAMKMAGIEITAEQVARGIIFETRQVIIKRDLAREKETVILGIFQSNLGELNGQRFRLFIANFDRASNQWVWEDFRPLHLSLFYDTKVLTTVDLGDPNHNISRYKDIAALHYSGIAPMSAYRDPFLQYGGAKYWKTFCEQNKVPMIRMTPLFWFLDVPRSINSKERLNDYIDERIKYFLTHFPQGSEVVLTIAGEPFWRYRGNYGWQGQYENSRNPLYDFYQKDWIIQATVRLFQIANEKGIVPGEDFQVILIDERGVMLFDRGYRDFVVNEFKRLRKNISIQLGLSENQLKVGLGLEFQLGYPNGDRSDPIPPNYMTEQELSSAFNELQGLLGSDTPLHITELDPDTNMDDVEVANLYKMVLKLSQRYGIRTLTLWENLGNKPKQSIWHNRVYIGENLIPTIVYYMLLSE